MSKPNALIMKLSDLLGPTYVPVNLNTGLDLNGNCPADASVAINGFIGQATAKLPAILIFDIGVACYGSILLPTVENNAAYPSIVNGDAAGHVSLIGMGWDTGIYMMPGSNSHCISGHPGRLGDGKYPVFDPGGTAPAQSNLNIRIAGLAINGNRGTGAAVVTPTATTTLGSNQITVSAATSIAIGQLATGTGLAAPSFVSAIAGTTVTLVDQNGKAANATAGASGVTVSFYASNSTTGDPRGIITPSGGFNNVTWYCGVSVFSAAGMVIENVSTQQIPTYNIRTSNTSDLFIDKIKIAGVGAANGDGIHIDGPATRPTISNVNTYNVNDDNIAFNGPEGYGGDITDFAVNNCNFTNAVTGIRMYTYDGGVQHALTDGAISNVNMYFSYYGGAGFSFGYTKVSSATQAFINRVAIANVNIINVAGQNGSFLFVGEGVNDVTIDNCTWTPGAHSSGSVIGSGFFGTSVSACACGSIRVSNFRILRQGAYTHTALGVSGDTALTITTLDLDVQIDDPVGTSYAAGSYYINPNATKLTVNKLIVRRLDPTHIASFINGATWTGLNSITGEGLVGCGFQIPDANVGNNTMYKSATTAGELTWKDGAGAIHGLAAGS